MISISIVDDSLGVLSRYFYDLSHHEPVEWFWTFGDGAKLPCTSYYRVRCAVRNYL